MLVLGWCLTNLQQRQVAQSIHPIYTVGHSNYSIEAFLALLSSHAIHYLCDVRSHPYSKYNPQFNQQALIDTLSTSDICYLYLGDSLGGRQTDCMTEAGTIDYARVARKPTFLAGCRTLKELASEHQKVALMCAEKDPAHCHRNALISNHLPFECDVRHIMSDGSILPHQTLRESLESRSLFD